MKNDLVWEHFQHSTFQKGCSECYKEARLIRAKAIVNLGTAIGQGRLEDWSRSFYNNPLER